MSGTTSELAVTHEVFSPVKAGKSNDGSVVRSVADS